MRHTLHSAKRKQAADRPGENGERNRPTILVPADGGIFTGWGPRLR